MGSMAHNGVEHTHVFAILPGWRRVGMVVGEASLQTALHIRWQVELVPVCLHADFGDGCQARGGTRVMEPELGCAVGTTLLTCSQANTDVASLLTCTHLLLTPIVQVSMLQCHIQYTRIVPTVIDVARRYLIGELIGLDEIPAAQFYTINTQLIGSSIYQSLQHPVADI